MNELEKNMGTSGNRDKKSDGTTENITLGRFTFAEFTNYKEDIQ